ncbi:MAG: phenylacetate--CoA ligase, partial [Proteobacteria bacterium]|nr:phenylacetate--CoA ligase [Pseudomonadota bacterium]
RDAKLLGHRIKTMVGITVAIDVRPSGTLDRSTGKAARVLDKRPRV